MRHYPGYTIATPEQRAFAERQHVTIGAVDNAPWNLKNTLNDYLTKTITTLTQAKNDLSGRKVITASEAAGIMNTINSDEKDMLTHIEKANLMSTGPVVAASPAKTEAPSAASTPVESPAPTEPVSEPAKAPEPVSEPAKAPEPVSEPAKAPEPVSEPAKAPVPPTPRTPLSGPDGLPPAPPARNQAEEDMASYTQGAAKLQDPAVKQRIARAGALEDEDVAPNRNRTSQYESRNYSGPLDIFYN
jgi:DNA polymerase-3 subunit gamma/tau